MFTTEYSERSAAESTLVEALHNAVGAGEFRLLYQPKISLATRRITGVEALLRWEHPERGLIAPGEFIAAAERSGAIVPIGAWVLKESLRQAAVWQQAYPTTPLRVAINVSARQLSTELARTVSDTMNEVGIRPNAVCLEVTETMLMENIDQTIEILDELKALGLTVSIDDFGTGYSSLEYLHRMPIDEVKIDQSFVAGLGSDAVNTAIVASVISLAHAMHLEVVAEGVETVTSSSVSTTWDVTSRRATSSPDRCPRPRSTSASPRTRPASSSPVPTRPEAPRDHHCRRRCWSSTTWRTSGCWQR